MTAREFERIAQEVGALPDFNPAALTEHQLEAMKGLERAKKRVRGSLGKPLWQQRLADEELLTALAFVEEFDALTIRLEDEG